MRQFMGKLHQPVKVMPYSWNEQEQQKNHIGTKPG